MLMKHLKGDKKGGEFAWLVSWAANCWIGWNAIKTNWWPIFGILTIISIRITNMTLLNTIPINWLEKWYIFLFELTYKKNQPRWIMENQPTTLFIMWTTIFLVKFKLIKTTNGLWWWRNIAKCQKCYKWSHL